MAFATEPEARLKDRQLHILVQRLVFYSCLAYLLFLLVRLPVEDAEAAMERYAATYLPPSATCDRVQGQPESVRELACLRAQITTHADDSRAKRNRVWLLIAVIGIIAVLVGVQRRRDRMRLREQLRFNEQLIDAMPLPLSMRSPESRFMLVNRAFEARYGVSRERLIGHKVADLFPAEFADRVLEMDQLAAGATEPRSGTFYVPTQQGMRHVQVCVLGLRRGDGTLIGTVGVQTDVTDMVDKEAALSESNAKLTQLSMKMIGAQEEERRRIARDLHDHVGQILTALKLQLSSLAKRAKIDEPQAALVTPIDLTEEALAHTRNLSASLHPHLLDDLGLEPAINWLIDRFIRPSLPNVKLRCRMDPPRGPEAFELVAFRVVQEALTNVVRHAHASRAGVMLDAANGELTIEVIDDGVGFDASETGFDLQRSSSVGLTGMRDRVAELGGDVHVHSVDGQGTSVRVRLAWPAREGA